MEKDKHLKKTRWKKGQSGNPSGRPKGSMNRSTMAKKWMEVEVTAINPLTLEEEKMTQEDLMTLAQIRKALKGDTAAYKELNINKYGPAKESIAIETDAPSIDFSKILVFKDDPADRSD